MIECALGLLSVLGFLYGGNDPAYLIAAGFLIAISFKTIFIVIIFIIFHRYFLLIFKK